MKSLIIVGVGTLAYFGASQIGRPFAMYICVAPFAVLTAVSLFNWTWLRTAGDAVKLSAAGHVDRF